MLPNKREILWGDLLGDLDLSAEEIKNLSLAETIQMLAKGPEILQQNLILSLSAIGSVIQADLTGTKPNLFGIELKNQEVGGQLLTEFSGEVLLAVRDMVRSDKPEISNLGRFALDTILEGMKL